MGQGRGRRRREARVRVDVARGRPWSAGEAAFLAGAAAWDASTGGHCDRVAPGASGVAVPPPSDGRGAGGPDDDAPVGVDDVAQDAGGLDDVAARGRGVAPGAVASDGAGDLLAAGPGEGSNAPSAIATADGPRAYGTVVPDRSWDEVHAVAAALAGAAPGPDLLAMLEGLEVADVDDAALTEGIAAAQRVVSRATALLAGWVAELARRREHTASMDGLTAEVGVALTCTEPAAQGLIGLAVGLDRLPVVADTLAAGLIDTARATCLLAALDPLLAPGGGTYDPPAAQWIAAELCQVAPTLTARQLGDRARRRVLKHDAQAARTRATKARADRKVIHSPAPDSMSWVSAFLPAEDAVAVMTTVTQLAELAATGGDARTLDQRRADAFVDVFGRILDTGLAPCTGAGGAGDRRGDTGATSGARAPGDAEAGADRRERGVPEPDDDPGTSSGSGSGPGTGPGTGTAVPAHVCAGTPLPTRHGRRPHLQVVANRSTILGLDDDPAHLAGYGPVPADLAREIAARATWQPLLVDDDGSLLAAGTYRIPRHLRDFAAAREITCTFPGCRMPADRCDLDHVDPFDPTRPAAEQTTGDNLRHLCRHHHRLKTSGRWTVTLEPGSGDSLWSTPTGRTHRRPLDPGPVSGGTADATRPRSDDRGQDPPAGAPPPF